MGSTEQQLQIERLQTEKADLQRKYDDLMQQTIQKYEAEIELLKKTIKDIEEEIRRLKETVALLETKVTDLETKVTTYDETKRKKEEERTQQLLLGQIAFRFVDATFTKIFEDPQKRRGELRCNTLKQLDEDASANRLSGDELKRWSDLKTEWEKEKKKWWYIERALKALKKGRLDIAHHSFGGWKENQIEPVIQIAKKGTDDGTAADIEWIYKKLVANAKATNTAIIS